MQLTIFSKIGRFNMANKTWLSLVIQLYHHELACPVVHPLYCLYQYIVTQRLF